MDIGKVQQAIQEYFIDITDDLVDIAEDTYVLASILASDKLLKRGIQSSEIQALTTKRKPTDKLSSDDILELDELARENSSEFVDNYESELVNGGRTINVKEWEDLPVAESSDYARDLRGEPRRADQIIKDSNIKVDIDAYKSKQLKIKSNDELKAGEIIPKLTPREILPYKKGINLPEGYTKYSSTNTDKLARDILEIRDLEGNESFKHALKEYTSGPYKKINQLARGEWAPASKSTEAKYQKLIDDLSAGLKEAPNYTGKVYRGIGFSTEEKFNDLLDIGSVKRFDGFTSTSLERNIAGAFEKMKDKPFRVSMEIESKTGTYLNGASSFRRAQEEVLFDRKSMFEVVSVEKYADNKAHVILREV